MSKNSSRRSSWRSSIASLTDLLKEHHAAVNGAYSSLHGGPRHYHSRPGMPAPYYSPNDAPIEVAHHMNRARNNLPNRRRPTITTREIVEPEREAREQKRPSLGRRLSGAWEEVKGMAKEHHRAVNEAYQAYAGSGMHRGESADRTRR
jgi:hypothetical protein